ncbi:serine protease inhibitor 27A-like [Planococcus citri]|uniref:serine protease inhibitor 27A-like n=1 Tax=Planococcus citri TaxID=170843 RepID=UPI0031F86DA1
MFRRILLLLAIGQFVAIKSENSQNSTSIEKTIATETLKNMIGQVRAYWEVTPSDQNIQFGPISWEIVLQMLQIKLYHESLLASLAPKDKYLEKPYALAGVLDKLQQTSNAQLKFMNAIFYDQRNTSKHLLDDLKSYYHAEALEVSFDSDNNAAILASLNEWMNRSTKGRAPNTENLNTKGLTNLQSSVLSYTSCWDTSKTSTNFIKLLKFKTPSGEIDVETFNVKEKIGYYNNRGKKYEAIRLPYKKGEFALIILLPNQNQSLESISKLTVNDYQELLQRVSENHENIEYSIPFMNLTTTAVHENGTSINEDDTIICEWSSTQKARVNNETGYKSFHVNRPFAMFLYHEKTKIILMYTFVKDPTLGILKSREFKIKVTATNEKTELQLNR